MFSSLQCSRRNPGVTGGRGKSTELNIDRSPGSCFGSRLARISSVRSATTPAYQRRQGVRGPGWTALDPVRRDSNASEGMGRRQADGERSVGVGWKAKARRSRCHRACLADGADAALRARSQPDRLDSRRPSSRRLPGTVPWAAIAVDPFRKAPTPAGTPNVAHDVRDSERDHGPLRPGSVSHPCSL